MKLWENRGWKKIWTVARSTKFHAPSHCPAYIIGVARKQAFSCGFKYFGRYCSTCLDNCFRFVSSSEDLFFDRKIRPHICHRYHGLYLWRKFCHVENFQISVKNLNNLWSFIEIYGVFVLNLRGQKSVWRKSLWNKK